MMHRIKFVSRNLGYIDNNQLRCVDLSYLSTLTNLWEICLVQNELHSIDLSPLKLCSSFQDLHLHENSMIRDEIHEHANPICMVSLYQDMMVPQR